MIVKCKLMPKGICLNLFGTFWVKDPSWVDRYVVNHERIHTAQQRELLFVPFYLLYVVEWVVKFCKYGSWKEAYYNISFEREAYTHGHDLGYLPSRRHYAWLKFLRKR